MKQYFDEKDYNLEYDGEIKDVNGAAMFVPFMYGLDDKLVKIYIKELLNIDWLHYKLYLVGGVLEGWKTTDIDVCVTGKRTKELPSLLDKARSIGPLDMYWVKSLDEIKGNGSRVWKFAKSHDRFNRHTEPWIGKWKKDGLYHMSYKFPIKEDREYKKEPLLIN